MHRRLTVSRVGGLLNVGLSADALHCDDDPEQPLRLSLEEGNIKTRAWHSIQTKGEVIIPFTPIIT